MTVKHCEIPLKGTPANINLPNGWLKPKRELGVREEGVAEYWEEWSIAFHVLFARLSAHSSTWSWSWLRLVECQTLVLRGWNRSRDAVKHGNALRNRVTSQASWCPWLRAHSYLCCATIFPWKFKKAGDTVSTNVFIFFQQWRKRGSEFLPLDFSPFDIHSEERHDSKFWEILWWRLPSGHQWPGSD